MRKLNMLKLVSKSILDYLRVSILDYLRISKSVQQYLTVGIQESKIQYLRVSKRI